MSEKCITGGGHRFHCMFENEDILVLKCVDCLEDDVSYKFDVEAALAEGEEVWNGSRI